MSGYRGQARYIVTASTIIYGDFYDSGDAHRYAKGLSKRLKDTYVDVTREDGAMLMMKDHLASCVEYRNGKQVIYGKHN